MTVKPNLEAKRSAAQAKTRQRILKGARTCFARLGIDKATIVDIAEAAQYSRPIIYKHFNDKADIVDSVCLKEMQLLQRKLNVRVKRDQPFADQLVDAILEAVLIARNNIYIKRFMEDREAWVRSQTQAGIVHVWVRDRWSAFFKRGQALGILASDIDINESVTWISMVQSLLLIRFASEEIDREATRHFVERFVVRPLLAQRE